MRPLERFREIWLVDFEFISQPGERPIPVCMVAHEMAGGRKLRLWRDQFEKEPPFGIGPESLFVAYYTPAELGCFLSLGWPMPSRILDLYVEFRNLTNGWPTLAGNSLLGAMTHFGLDGIGAAEKEHMRKRVMAGGPWSQEDRRGILDYCASDVDALGRLLPVMLPQLDLPRAIYRGRQMVAIAAMEFHGVPINRERLDLLRENWEPIQDRLIARINPAYQVFEGRTFKRGRFEGWLIRNNVSWPRLESGQLDLEDDTFREMSKSVPAVAPLRELRHALSEMRLNALAVGSDNRNRVMLSPFGARSGRNTPSNTKYIFGPSVWLRNLIEPPAGYGLAYIDWVQQEFGIAAALSGDPSMLSAYKSGDCYLAFAKQAGAVPPDATKESHPVQRGLFKTCILGVNYGMESRSLAMRIGRPEIEARNLLQRYREICPKFWQWGDNATDHAVLCSRQWTSFGWVNRVPPEFNPRSLRNFHMQAEGGELLRLACCLGIERGLEIVAPIHDAVMICSPLEHLENDAETMRACMAEASRVVLGGFTLRTDARLIRHPDHYSDPRAELMWREVMGILCQNP